MKFKIRKYDRTISFGICYTWVNYIKYLIIDIGPAYIEIIINDYD